MGGTLLARNPGCYILRASSKILFDSVPEDELHGQIMENISMFWAPKVTGHRFQSFFTPSHLWETSKTISMSTKVLITSAPSPYKRRGIHLAMFGGACRATPYLHFFFLKARRKKQTTSSPQ